LPDLNKETTYLLTPEHIAYTSSDTFPLNYALQSTPQQNISEHLPLKPSIITIITPTRQSTRNNT